ncbi:ion channel [Rudaea cellulosilytica]|uniref:ion channel n=1 Tax=Rudaea cellulosilytica TaxID=540746 RepID=UPI000363B710|nr:ion channel [Rudaea cellulosilytica]
MEHAASWGINSVVVVATGATVCLCVLLHYECLSWLSRQLMRLQRHRRRRVLFGIFGLLLVHIAEIWLFGCVYATLAIWPAFGEVSGASAGLLDDIYVSAMTFTTVGASDVSVKGPLRFLAGTEALSGLVLIAWSASFTYLEMERFWREP